jgi:urease accessory protein
MAAPPTIMPTNDRISALQEGTLYRLITWLSPAFPVGAFSFSHGLEIAVEDGAIRDRASLQDWICAVVALGSGRIDADFLRDTYRAAMADDFGARIANQRGVAFRTTAEMAVESTGTGAAVLDTCRAAWPDPFLYRWFGALNGCSVCYAAAVGAATARAGVSLEWALTGYLQAMSSNLVSAGLRLGIPHRLMPREPIRPIVAGQNRVLNRHRASILLRLFEALLDGCRGTCCGP